MSPYRSQPFVEPTYHWCMWVRGDPCLPVFIPCIYLSFPWVLMLLGAMAPSRIHPSFWWICGVFGSASIVAFRFIFEFQKVESKVTNS